MIDYSYVWAQIEADDQMDGAVVRRVLPALGHDVFIGQHRPSRERFAELRLTGCRVGPVPAHVPKTHGLEVRVVLQSSDSAVIRLTETTPVRSGQFEDLVADVLAELDRDPGDGSTSRLVDRVVAWQDFFAREGGPLRAEEAAGLYAELAVLQEVLIPAAGVVEAVGHWTGPEPGLQDYQFDSGAIEVKSFRGVGPGVMHISSERQLDTTGSQVLFIAYVELDERRNGTGDTLGELVASVRALVADRHGVAALLEHRLRQARWRDTESDSRPERYVVRALEFLEVADGFPRLVPEVLPEGVGHVQYRVDRSAVDEYVRSTEEVIAALELTNG